MSRAAQPMSKLRLWETVPWPVKRCVAPVFRLLPPTLWLGRRYRRAAAFVAQADRWSADQSAAYQLEALRRVCTIALEAPYYRERFAALGFDPRDLRSFADFRALPTIDKNTVIASAERMCARPPGAPGVDVVSTGGTSGTPVKFYIDAGRSATEYAYLSAGWRRAGYHPDMPQAVLRGMVVPPDRHGLRHQYDPILRRHFYSAFHMTDENLRRYVDHMATIGPCYLHVYPSSMLALTRFLERSGLSLPANVRGILAGSEILYPADRARVERVTGLRCFSWYGHSEKLVMAAECEHSSDYHVWPTYGYFELLDEEGRAVTTPGQRGEIVGTGFINTVMPFIRYRTGDMAEYVGDRCAACGRQHPIIREVRGHRTQETLITADGSEISWTAVNMHDDTFDGVRQFQFLQTTPGAATLRIVPAAEFAMGDIERIRRNLNRKLEGRIAFDVAVVEEIPLTRSGKTTYVDQRITLPTKEGVLA